MSNFANCPTIEFPIQLNRFLALPVAEVAGLVRRSERARVLGFPINGTRRWYALEYGFSHGGRHYLAELCRRSLELWRLFFDHGVESLVAPIFGHELLERRGDYDDLLAQMLKPGLQWFYQEPEVLAIYDEYEIRVSIYGEMRALFEHLPELREVEDGLMALCEKTSRYDKHRLLLGLFAQDPAPAIAKLSIEFFQEFARVPTREEIVERYMGQPVGPLDIFIGFNCPTFFDMPLISIGQEDLYFTVCPSPYLDEHSLRHILYDRLYARRVSETYCDPIAVETMREFYRLNRHSILGLGRSSKDGSFWFPTAEVKIPNGL